MPLFRIAGLNISIDCPVRMIEPRILEFASDGGSIDIRCQVLFEKNLRPDVSCITILDTQETTISKCRDYLHVFYKYPLMQSAVVAFRDWSRIKIYLDSAYERCSDAETLNRMQNALLDALSTVVISALTYHGGVLIHSASIVWDDRGIVFSAPSGTGKTTHTDMWCKRYGVKVLDGDVTACRVIDGKLRVYGLPWCGESGKFLNECVPLGAVVFLEQGESNSITKLAVREAFMLLYARCYLYVLDEGTADRIMETVTAIVTGTDCYLLKCRPDFEAVELVKECLEKAWK